MSFIPFRQNRGSAEWRCGWPVVFASALGISLTTIHIYGVGLFFEPLEQEFGWSRGEVSGALLLPSVIALCLAPYGGRLIDKWGPRKVALPAITAYCASVAALSFTSAWIGSWWLLWILMGVSYTFLLPTVWSAAVSSWFIRGRGFALAVTLCGTGVGAAVIPALSNTLINQFGWRGAFIGLGIIGVIVILPVAFLCFYRAGDRPDPANAEKPATASPAAGYSFKEGVRTRYFYRLVIAGFGSTFAIVGLVVHLVPLLGTLDIDRGSAVAIASMVGIPSIIGRLSIGFLIDRFHGPYIGAVSIGLPTISVLMLLAFPGSVTAAIIAIVILGLSIGGEYDAVIYLSTRYFGLLSFGALFGVVAALISLGMGTGPMIAGTIFDLTGSYHFFLILVIPLTAIPAWMLATLGPYPHPDNHADPVG
ncbi:MFS transporter [Pacificimonas sp. ICDLI1SI03]